MKRLFLIAAVAMLTGCATIISGSTQDITFVSTPDGATVYDNGFPVGRTPLMASFQRDQNHLVTIELAGYEPFQILLRKEFNAWYLGNILLAPLGLGIVGLIVDPITGAIYKLSPDFVAVDMTGAKINPRTPAKPSNPDELVLDIVLVPVASGELIGQMTSIKN